MTEGRGQDQYRPPVDGPEPGQHHATGGLGGIAGFHADDPVGADRTDDVVDRSHSGQVHRGHPGHTGEDRDGHACRRDAQGVGRRRHRMRVEAAGVHIVGVDGAERSGQGVHLGHEGHLRAGVPDGQGVGRVVGRLVQEGLQELQLGQRLPGLQGDVGLIVPQVHVELGRLVRRDGDGRTAAAEGHRVVAQYHQRGSHLGQGGDGHGLLRPGLLGVAECRYGHRGLAAGRPRGGQGRSRHHRGGEKTGLHRGLGQWAVDPLGRHQASGGHHHQQKCHRRPHDDPAAASPLGMLRPQHWGLGEDRRCRRGSEAPSDGHRMSQPEWSAQTSRVGRKRQGRSGSRRPKREPGGPAARLPRPCCRPLPLRDPNASPPSGRSPVLLGLALLHGATGSWALLVMPVGPHSVAAPSVPESLGRFWPRRPPVMNPGSPKA